MIEWHLKRITVSELLQQSIRCAQPELLQQIRKFNKLTKLSGRLLMETVIFGLYARTANRTATRWNAVVETNRRSVKCMQCIPNEWLRRHRRLHHDSRLRSLIRTERKVETLPNDWPENPATIREACICNPKLRLRHQMLPSSGSILNWRPCALLLWYWKKCAQHKCSIMLNSTELLAATVSRLAYNNNNSLIIIIC